MPCFRRGCLLDEADLTEWDTALHLATRHANNEMVAILLRKGANTDTRNKVFLIKNTDFNSKNA